MILTCENCQRRYSVAEEMLRGKAIKLRCKSCQHVISAPVVPEIAGPNPSSSPAPAKDVVLSRDVRAVVTAPTESSGLWFAMVKGRQAGPLQLDQLASRIKSGEVGQRTYVWREGMIDWKRGADVPELSPLFADPGKPGFQASGSDEKDASYRRESFDQQEVSTTLESDGGPVIKGRPLPGLKLSPELLASRAEASRDSEQRDPFRVGGEIDPDSLPPPGEETRFFIAEAGMHKRNPPWKIAGFVFAVIALPVSVLYLLSALKVGPLVVTRVDAAGNKVKESLFSAEGVSGLGDLLTGRKQAPKPVPTAESKSASRAAAKPPQPPKQSDPPVPNTTPASPELKAFYADSSHVDVGPTLRKKQEQTDEAGGGLAQAEVAKVVAQTQPGFQFCIEQEMKKNPAFRGGKVFISALVGSSGTVKRAAIDRPEIDSSTLGECLKTKARRMVFASFSGDDTEVQIPLILTTAL